MEIEDERGGDYSLGALRILAYHRSISRKCNLKMFGFKEGVIVIVQGRHTRDFLDMPCG